MDKIKCTLCKKKIGLIIFECKCKNNYCMNHRFRENHNCSYDYTQEEQEEFIKNNPKLIPNKINLI